MKRRDPCLCPPLSSSKPRHGYGRSRCALLPQLNRSCHDKRAVPHAATTAQPPKAARTSAMLVSNAPLKPNIDAHPFGIVTKTMMKSIIHLARVSWSVGPNASISYRLAKAQSAGG